MSHSGYLDKESKNILFNYQLLIEQQPVVGVAGVGMAQPGDTSVSPAVLDALFQSDFWFWFKIVDPTGWSSWPDLFAAGQRVHDVPSWILGIKLWRGSHLVWQHFALCQ